MKCPECGEELQPGVRVCPNCEYELTDAEFAQAGGAPAKPEVSAPAKPEVSAPARPTSGKPSKPAKPDVAMPESILSHGDVSVSHAEDNSVHNDNSVQNNVQHNVTDNSQTVNNTNQTVNNNTTILIMGGGQAPLPDNLDENTASAVRQAQQQMAQSAPLAEGDGDDGEKGVGSIVGGSGVTPSHVGSKVKTWIGIIVTLIVIGGCVALCTPSETKTNTPDKCVTAVQQQVDKGNLRTARKYIRNYEKSKDDIIEAYVTLLSKYLDEGKFKDAKSLVELYGQGEYTIPLNRGLYNYLLSVGDFDQAEEYINVQAKPSNIEYYKYMEECVKQLCTEGKKEEAKAFIAKKIVFFAPNSTGAYTKTRVEEKLNGVIAKY
ncbi:MAG: zinc ribbon domain-containing protein [Paludibacteraceae bacterium]|nr:zinc ribbon domain-containing protein [Paludibacteraceae bacterium]